MHSLAYCFAAKRKCFQEEVNVFAEYGVLNYWTYL
ncbi:leucine efflux protein LeuE, partial [Salmonella enterica]|nr:leucine efflux protein LeuE [Salmonella enterica]EDZ1636555.1 leucine efflux protein LeuE [Salmonella enterica subsp. enterica]MCD3069245.1 leucine efflux protein LeuE [Salmonella enterica subsp. enterica serovar Enteritidis]